MLFAEYGRDGGSRSLLRSEHGNGKIAFKTRSEVDVLDDGYRWRKYGSKKLVKNSPNPRYIYTYINVVIAFTLLHGSSFYSFQISSLMNMNIFSDLLLGPRNII